MEGNAEANASASKRWLARVATLKGRIEECDGMVEVVRSLAEPKGIDYTRPNVMSSMSKDAIADVVAAVDEMVGRWADERARLMSELDEAVETIHRLDDPTMSALLLMRYVDGMPWREVAERMAYSEAYCYELRDRACAMLEPLLPPGWRECPSKS